MSIAQRRTLRRDRATLNAITPAPKSRSFLVGSTGSGKSTLAATLLESYHALYPRHVLYVLDPKRRFITVGLDPENPSDRRLFPDGFREVNHGRRDGVSIVGDIVTSAQREEHPMGAYVVQDNEAVGHLFEELYSRADVRRPTLLYADESFDLIRGVRADPGLRRLLQQGREIGIGCLIVNQRPSWIDKTFLTESDTLYIGSLNHPNDRKTMAEVVASEPIRPTVEGWLPRHTWIYCDQHKPSARLFKLAGV